MSSLQAFPRADGSVGIRNIVLVVSTVTCANTVVNHIAWKTGAVPLTHERGCVEGEQSFRRTMLALATVSVNRSQHSVTGPHHVCQASQRVRRPHRGARL